MVDKMDAIFVNS